MAQVKQKAADAAPINSTAASDPMKVPQRNLLKEGRQGIQLMQEAYPALYQLQSQYNPQFAQLEAQTGAARSMAETQAVNASGTSIRDAIRGGSPEIAASSDALLAQLKDVGASPLETELQQQALTDLKLGGQLSPEEARAAVQAARGASSARGLGQGTPAAVLEVLNRDAASRGRLDARRSFAAGVDTNAQQRKAGDRSYVLNALNQSDAIFDPYQRMYGNGGSQASGQISGPSQYGNYLSAATNAGATNQNAMLAGMQLDQDQKQFDINREDSYYFSNANMVNGNANAAAARKASMKQGMVTAGAGLAAAGIAAGVGTAAGGAALGSGAALALLAFL
jgi:hypothetical protein